MAAAPSALALEPLTGKQRIAEFDGRERAGATARLAPALGRPRVAQQARKSAWLQRSTHIPPTKRRMVMPGSVTALPVGGMPISAPRCSPATWNRTATRSPAASSSSKVSWLPGKASQKPR